MSELIRREDAINAMAELQGIAQSKAELTGISKAWKRIKALPAASPWHRVGEKPRDGQECIVAYLGPTDWIYEHATYHIDLNKALEEDIFIDGTDGFIVDGDVGYARHSFNYWMPIEPPKEDA